MNKRKQRLVSVLLGLGLAGTLCAQKGITQGEALRLRQQFAHELHELQNQMEVSERESKHVVKDASVRKAEAQKTYEVKQSEQKPKVDTRSPAQRAKVEALLKESNAKLPEMNALLKQAFSNSTLPKIELKPLKSADLYSAGGGMATPRKSAEQQAMIQLLTQRLQEELKQLDPQARAQMKKVFAAAGQGKSLPLPPNVPPPLQTQLLPKGTP